MEVLKASDFLNDIRLDDYCLDVNIMIYRKKINLNVLIDLPYTILSIIASKLHKKSEDLLNLYDINQDFFQTIKPLIDVNITDIDHLPLFKGAKKIKYFSEFPIEYLNCLSESENILIRLESPIEEFPNPNGTLTGLSLRGYNIPFRFDNLSSLVNLQINCMIGDNIKYLPNLRCLSIDGYVKRNQIAPKIDLSNCVNLNLLVLYNISDNSLNVYETIKTISHPQKLESLKIFHKNISNFSDIGLDYRFSGLLFFSINNIRSLKGIRELSSIQKIKLSRIFHDTDILDIFDLPHIKNIKLSIDSIPENLNQLQKVSSSLEKIEIFFPSRNSVFDLSFLGN